MASLTHAQRHALKDLLDPDHYIRTSGPTNATLGALRKRGLADRIPAPIEHASLYRFFWVITDAGRVALAPADSGGAAR